MSDDTRDPTEPAPPPHDDEDTDPGGRRPLPPEPRVVLGPEAMSDLLVRQVLATEAMMRDVAAMAADMRAMRADQRLALEESRTHAVRLTVVERALSLLRCRPTDDCPADGSEAAE